MTFEQWMRQVNQEIESIVGLTSADLADYAYYDAFEDGESPADVAQYVLEDNGFDA